jgi:IS5 family transposase
VGRVTRDIRRRIEGKSELENRFGPLLDLAWHAPEVECIGKGKASPLRVRLQGVDRDAGDPAQGWPIRASGAVRQPFDGHTLGPVVAALEALTGVETRRIHVDKGYRGHTHPHKFRVWISGRTRGLTRTAP